MVVVAIEFAVMEIAVLDRGADAYVVRMAIQQANIADLADRRAIDKSLDAAGGLIEHQGDHIGGVGGDRGGRVAWPPGRFGTVPAAHMQRAVFDIDIQPPGMAALLAALLGTVTAYVFYGRRLVDPGEIKRQLAAVHRFLVEKWRFDELYDAMFVRPVHIVAGWCVAIDRNVFDEFLHRVCRVTVDVSRWDRRVDESMVDGFVNLVGDTIFAVGRSLRRVQTGFLRQYIMFIAVGVLTLFVLVFSLFPK